jgi:hypothetical protein
MGRSPFIASNPATAGIRSHRSRPILAEGLIQLARIVPILEKV